MNRLQWLWAHTLGGALQWLLIAPIWVYQRTLSPLLPPSCRYYPSCSQYAITAIRSHGALKGISLAGWRLLRCNPWSAGGVDPVPSRGHWRPIPDGDHVHH